MVNKKYSAAAALFIAAIGLFLFLQLFRDGGGPDSEAPPDVRSASLAGEQVTVLTNHPHVRAADALAEWFHEETGAVVRNVVVNYDEALRYTLKDVSSPKPRIDIVMFWYVDLGALVEHDALVDLTDFIHENRSVIQPDDFIPSVYDPYTLYKGRRWALPYDGDTHVLFYRKSIFDKYGLTPPETWDEYLNIARTITENERDKGIYGTAIMAPPIPMIIVSSFMNRLGAYGGRLLDDDGAPAVDSAEAEAALSAMIEHCKYALPTPLETDWEVSRDAFLSGRVAMVEQWTDIGLMAEDLEQSIIQGDWGAVGTPMGKGDRARRAAALNSGFSLGISARASNIEAARAYLLFANRPDVALRLNLINGGMDPTRFSVLDSPEYRKMAPELSRAVRAAMEKATPWPTSPRAPLLLNILKDNLVMALEGRKTPRRALEETRDKWDEALAE